MTLDNRRLETLRKSVPQKLRQLPSNEFKKRLNVLRGQSLKNKDDLYLIYEWGMAIMIAKKYHPDAMQGHIQDFMSVTKEIPFQNCYEWDRLVFLVDFYHVNLKTKELFNRSQKLYAQNPNDDFIAWSHIDLMMLFGDLDIAIKITEGILKRDKSPWVLSLYGGLMHLKGLSFKKEGNLPKASDSFRKSIDYYKMYLSSGRHPDDDVINQKIKILSDAIERYKKGKP